MVGTSQSVHVLSWGKKEQQRHSPCRGPSGRAGVARSPSPSPCSRWCSSSAPHGFCTFGHLWTTSVRRETTTETVSLLVCCTSWVWRCDFIWNVSWKLISIYLNSGILKLVYSGSCWYCDTDAIRMTLKYHLSVICTPVSWPHEYYIDPCDTLIFLMLLLAIFYTVHRLVFIRSISWFVTSSFLSVSICLSVVSEL